VRTKRARVHVGRALAQHYPNAVPFGQSPICCILPAGTEPEDVYSALLSHDQDDCRGDGPATNTVRRVLQDLTAYGLLARQGQGEGNPDLWAPTASANEGDEKERDC
jgi:hypothetical protein